ncbi:hypothetical protein [Nitrosomonas communis]|uniref:Uncharacterized protein n=1 Tax=Nitrosomonas communis TaxID=44574 RepID=A0A1I4IPA1_9PROT|nr:hypothetical protein [Nitrosomonas communis]SFL56105.1 hypothetical protein SAMN05421863_10013 [Nitrosomonas communis]
MTSLLVAPTFAFSRHFHRTAVRLPDFSRKPGDTRNQCHCLRPSPDNLFQTPGTRQPPDAMAGASLVRSSQQCIAGGDVESGHRQYAGSTPIREGAEQHHWHWAQSHQEERPAAVSAGAMPGHVGRQCAGQCRPKVSAADGIPFSSRYWQSQQADYCAGVAAQSGSRDDEQARPVAGRC